MRHHHDDRPTTTPATLAALLIGCAAASTPAIAQDDSIAPRMSSVRADLDRAIAARSSVPVVEQARSDSRGSLLSQRLKDARAAGMETSSLMLQGRPDKRTWREHDLITVVILESSKAERTQDLEARKRYAMSAEVETWTSFELGALWNGGFRPTAQAQLPAFALGGDKDYKGEGDYEREDRISGRVTAEVIAILPNGNLMIEARHEIVTDREVGVTSITGICDPDQVSPEGSILSWQLHDLRLEKMHEGDVKDAAQKGVIARIIDTIFAF